MRYIYSLNHCIYVCTMIISFYINFNGKNSVIYFNIFNFFQFLHNKLLIFFNYNLSLFLIFIYCILLYVCVCMYSMYSLVVSVQDSPAVDPRSNPGSGSALLMSEKSQAVYYISSCHMLIDKALSSDKPNGHWFEADWLHCKRDALSSNRKVDGSRLTGSIQACHS